MDAREIVSLVGARAPETLFLEFKRDLPSGRDGEKSEFLADVSAFANASGGVILYGVSEVDGCADEIVGVDGDRFATVSLWLTELLRSGVEPRLQNIGIDLIVIDEKAVIEISIPQSVLRPHWVSARGERRFYLRGTAGKAPMSMDEVRSAFQNAGHALQQAEDWRTFSVGQLQKAFTARSTLDKVWMALHVCPIASVLSISPPQFDVRPPARHEDRLASWNRNTNCRPHYEGLISDERGPDGRLRDHLLVRRDHRVQMAWLAGQEVAVGGEPTTKWIFAGSNETNLNRWFEKFLSWAETNRFPLPAIVFLTVFNADNSYVRSSFSNFKATADCLFLSPCYVEQYSDSAAAVFRPAYDHLWQSYGFDNCVLYGADGAFDGNYNHHAF